MTKCYLDSNFLAYWKNRGVPQYKETQRIVEQLQQNETLLYVSPLVIDEYIHAMMGEARVNKHYNPYEVAEKSLNDLLALPLLTIVPTPWDIPSQTQMLTFMKTYSLRPRDAYHLLTMQANDIDGFATFDTDFARVFAAKLLTKA
ncbi:type II toxin-antitoxin system VapC family toxin [Candidatus Gottesmanbacteria bacterium]|nr:type II toxin-antitoxin system VapC family toxin [Candidatus Gottesmanbacteria bacterium]